MFKDKIESALNYAVTFLKWGFIAGCTGLLGGVVGTLFHKSVEFATVFRTGHEWIIWFLPAGGVVILSLYKLCRIAENTGTNEVISSVRSDEKVPPALAPLIFISTVITHLFGGSAGREGAALQLGGSIGSVIGRIFRLDEKDMHIITLCGMSSVFAALFGTPLTAAFFALEVISVGVIYYSGLVPCIISSLVAFKVSLYFGVKPISFSYVNVPEISLSVLAKTIGLAVICAVVSIVFCMTMKQTRAFMKRIFKNEFVRIMAGGLAISALTFLLQTRDYNGAGMNIITDAISGSARPEAFLLKIIFTAITIGAGYKGGEIVPTFFIGATLGCVAGGLLGIGAGFGAAIGLVALFCSVVNCPIASIILSIETFGADGLILFAITCAISYMLSGYYGLYSTQKIMYSKLRAEYININAK
ncbi:MAG: chloride channel protein [Clostridiaceae bacterium]